MGLSSSTLSCKSSNKVVGDTPRCGCGLMSKRLCANHIRLGWVATEEKGKGKEKEKGGDNKVDTEDSSRCGCGLKNKRLCANHIRLGWT